MHEGRMQMELQPMITPKASPKKAAASARKAKSKKRTELLAIEDAQYRTFMMTHSVAESLVYKAAMDARIEAQVADYMANVYTTRNPQA